MTAIERRCEALLDLETEYFRYFDNGDYEMSNYVLKDIEDTIMAIQLIVENRKAATKWLLNDSNK